MQYQIEAQTERGESLVHLAEELSRQFAKNAHRLDRDGEFPTAHLDALKRTGFLYAGAPVSTGGLGVESVHDLFVASSRIARSDASLMLGVNMHLVIMQSMARQREIACNRNDLKRVRAVESAIAGFVQGGAVIAAAVSEPNQDLTRPATTATRTEAGWVVNGRKIITSMAPVATHFSVSLGYRDGDGVDRYAYAIVPSDLDGLRVHDDWDALGMRASASTSVTFEDCLIPNGPGRGAVAGMLSPEYLEATLLSGVAHASSALGIAEAADHIAVETVCRKRQRDGDDAVRATARHLAAEYSIDLAASRAMFQRALLQIERYYREHPVGLGSLDDAHGIFAEVQRAKSFLNQAAIRIVDRAMTIVGGAAFMNNHPLSRLYRDARAGAFMHPLGANVAFEYLGAVALGISPVAL